MNDAIRRGLRGGGGSAAGSGAMIIPDANLIIYAHNEADPDHEAARE